MQEFLVQHSDLNNSGSQRCGAERVAAPRETPAGISARAWIQHAHRWQMAPRILQEGVHPDLQGIRHPHRLLDRSSRLLRPHGRRKRERLHE